jgi:hypothetical protein
MSVLDDAVKAARLYQGAVGLSITQQQRLYNKVKGLCDRVARDKGLDYGNVYEQVFARASSLGAIRPTPGKDI